MEIWKNILRICVYLILSTCLILIYFHIQCLQEKEDAEEKRLSEYYDPKQLDCEVQMPFVKSDRQNIKTFLGFFYTNILHNFM